MKTRSNMPLFVVECEDVKALSNTQIDLLRCGDYLVKKDASGEHAYKVTFKSDTGMCITYHDAYCVETQSYDKIDGVWTYNSEDKTVIAEPQFENIVDAQGHNRFIEGNITCPTISDVSFSFAKWSLCGSHLLIVIAGAIENGGTLSSGTTFTIDDMPEWMLDKIYPVVSTYLDSKDILFRDEDWQTQSVSVALVKETILKILTTASITATSNKGFRVAFDLLIDDE